MRAVREAGVRCATGVAAADLSCVGVFPIRVAAAFDAADGLTSLEGLRAPEAGVLAGVASGAAGMRVGLSACTPAAVFTTGDVCFCK